MSNNFEPKDENFEDLNNDEIKEEMLEEDILIQEEFKDEFTEDIDNETEIEENVTNRIDYEEDSESELDTWFKYGTNNHKLDGKHSLKRDTILNGRIVESTNTDEEIYTNSGNILDLDVYDIGDIPLEKGSTFEEESKKADDVQTKRKLAEDVYFLLKKNTDLDFRANRRKPNKTTFNNYYKMLLTNVDKQYTQCEIFTELAYYFTDNIFNMYKLLDKKYATSIIRELREKGFLNNLKSINFQ
jgi:hypothetical protein